ncbi:MAG: PAS domain S-box protein [Gemmataceae bacterium]
MAEPIRHPVVGYLLAVGGPAAVALASFAHSDLVGAVGLSGPLVLAVLLAAGAGGLGPGLLATALGLAAANLAADPPLVLVQLVFAGCGTAVSWLFDRLHGAYRRLDRDRAQLHESEQYHRLITELTSDFVWSARVEPDGTVVTESVSDGFFRLLGYTLADVQQAGWVTVVHPEERERAVAIVGQALRGQIIRGEMRHVARDGRVVWVHFLTRPEVNAAGRVVRLVGAAHDVTARKQTERALRETRERFRVAQELSLDGFTILRAVRDAGGRVVDFEWEYVNPAAAAILHRPADELVGRRLLEVLPGNQQSSELFDRYVQVVETGRPHDLELRYASEGIDGWFRNMTVKLGDGVAVSFADVTEHHQRQEELRASEARFRQLAEAMPHIVWVADPAGNNVYLSGRWIEFTGRPIADGLGCGWEEQVHPDDRAAVRGRWQVCVHDGTAYHADYRLRDRSGGYRWQLARALPVRDRDGVVVAWYGTSTDIDEQRRLSEALRDADRKKDEFLATLAHELRGPLAPIRNAVHYLKLSGPSDPPTQAARDVIDRQVGHMALLIDDLLDISRITLNKMELRRERVALTTILTHAVETARPYAEKAGHQIAVRLPDEPVDLDADPARLTQVFGNLLTNACKYTDRDGRIELSAARAGDEVVVTVRDNGIGIAPEHLPHLFEKFSQVAPALSEPQGGLGIGLGAGEGAGRDARRDGDGAQRRSRHRQRVRGSPAPGGRGDRPRRARRRPKRGDRTARARATPHPRRRRQPRQRRVAGDAPAADRPRGVDGARWAGRGGDGRAHSPGRGAARPRHAEIERLRGMPPPPRAIVERRDIAGGGDRLGPGGRPPPYHRRRVRRSPGQADRPDRPHRPARHPLTRRTIPVMTGQGVRRRPSSRHDRADGDIGRPQARRLLHLEHSGFALFQGERQPRAGADALPGEQVADRAEAPGVDGERPSARRAASGTDRWRRRCTPRRCTGERRRGGQPAATGQPSAPARRRTATSRNLARRRHRR